ncbi:MAG: Rieske (2Fe-2S) protein [Cytophagales bacterium]|nr:Rieske (2Fe-2S) protein [Cytophagales bacterium]
MIRWYRIFKNLDNAKKAVPLHHMQLIIAKGRKICLAHSNSGFHVVDDFCPHLGESLSKGNINFLNEIICPWHSYRFNLKTGEECQGRTPNLAVHQIKFDDTGFYVGIKD